MGLADDAFIDCILKGLKVHFDELDIPWIAIFLKNMAQLGCDDRGMLLNYTIEFSNDLHLVLKKAYEKKS